MDPQSPDGAFEVKLGFVLKWCFWVVIRFFGDSFVFGTSRKDFLGMPNLLESGLLFYKSRCLGLDA